MVFAGLFTAGTTEFVVPCPFFFAGPEGLQAAPADLLHSLHRAKLLHQRLQLRGVIDHHREHAREEAVVGVDADGTQQDVVLLIYNNYQNYP